MGLFSKNRRKEAEPKEPAAPLHPAPWSMSYQVANLQGIGSRSGQEDSFAFVNAMDVTEIRNNGLLAVMADGIGGLADGKLVSEAAVRALVGEFSAMDREKDLAVQLKDSVFRINEALFSQFQGRGGTTLVACIFYEEKLYFASVGDSYLYLKRGDGLYRMNRLQAYREELYLSAIADGTMDPTAACSDPDAGCLNRFLGMETLQEIDWLRRPFLLQDGDVLLLGSDGACQGPSEEALAECLSASSPEQALHLLEEELVKLGRVNQDNYTALAVVCGY